MDFTLGSLFDGIGGFPLAASRCSIKPVWASEIDKSCQKVTAYHFPEMKQMGDITKLHGDELEPVDIITGGSPCQDLSVAGKRAGLKGERSGLFKEMIRIVNEMRACTGKPRYVLWENVPGAFSSNKGEDFKAVLEAFLGHEVPMPKRWEPAGMADGLAWRVLDAQYFGVPQRRRRIFLIRDFTGGRADEILFEREGLSGDSSQGGEAGKDVARCLKACSNLKHREDSDNLVVAVQTAQTSRNGLGVSNGVAYTLDSSNGQAIARCVTACEGTRNDYETCTIIPTLRSNYRNNSNPITEASMLIMRNREGCDGGGKGPMISNKSFTLTQNNDQVVFNPAVRRLTPTECERLQGYPDGWTDLNISDSARYRMLGNSVAVPVVEWIMRRIPA